MEIRQKHSAAFVEKCFGADFGKSIFREGAFDFVFGRILGGQDRLADTDSRQLPRLRRGKDSFVASLVTADGIEVNPAPKIDGRVFISARMKMPSRKLRVVLEKLRSTTKIIVERCFEKPLRFIGEPGVTYPNLVGDMDATRAAERFAPQFALPLSVVAAPDWTVLAIHMGEITASDLEQIAAVADGLATGTLTPANAPSRLNLGEKGTGP